jgi:hypothetical protein
VTPPQLHGFHPAESTDLEEGYRRMAEDSEQEREAGEWCEAFMADATDISDSRPF